MNRPFRNTRDTRPNPLSGGDVFRHKGTSFVGNYFYCPYIPLTSTPILYECENEVLCYEEVDWAKEGF